MEQALYSLAVEVAAYLALVAAVAVIAPNLPQIIAALKGE